MLRTLFAALVVAAVGAAPVPKEDDAARLRRLYGSPIDPDKDCTFEMVGDKLRIKVPAKHHSLNASPGLMNAPRVWREVDGDFTAVVRVAFPVRTDPVPGADESYLAFATGGLVAWVPGGEQCRVVRREYTLSGKPREGFGRRLEGPNGANILDRVLAPPPGGWAGAGYLRLTRDGNKLKSADSRDGKEWKEHEAVEVGWGGKVKVGLVAENGFNAGFEVVFDEYTLTVPKK